MKALSCANHNSFSMFLDEAALASFLKNSVTVMLWLACVLYVPVQTAKTPDKNDWHLCKWAMIPRCFSIDALLWFVCIIYDTSRLAFKSDTVLPYRWPVLWARDNLSQTHPIYNMIDHRGIRSMLLSPMIPEAFQYFSGNRSKYIPTLCIILGSVLTNSNLINCLVTSYLKGLAMYTRPKSGMSLVSLFLALSVAGYQYVRTYIIVNTPSVLDEEYWLLPCSEYVPRFNTHLNVVVFYLSYQNIVRRVIAPANQIHIPHMYLIIVFLLHIFQTYVYEQPQGRGGNQRNTDHTLEAPRFTERQISQSNYCKWNHKVGSGFWRFHPFARACPMKNFFDLCNLYRVY